MNNQLPHQARKVNVRDDSWSCVCQQILQLVLEPQGHHIRCIVKRFNKHFSKIELTLVMKIEGYKYFTILFIQWIKATEQCFALVPFIMVYKVVICVRRWIPNVCLCAYMCHRTMLSCGAVCCGHVPPQGIFGRLRLKTGGDLNDFWSESLTTGTHFRGKVWKGFWITTSSKGPRFWEPGLYKRS